jgi:hypothetical protein
MVADKITVARVREKKHGDSILEKGAYRRNTPPHLAHVLVGSLGCGGRHDVSAVVVSNP